MFYGTLDQGLFKGYKDRPIQISYGSRKIYDHGGSCIYVKKKTLLPKIKLFSRYQYGKGL
jgi:hypothetical protein